MLLFCVLWILLMLVVCQCWLPGPDYTAGLELHVYYHLTWLIMTSLLLIIQYCIVSHIGHRALAINLDVCALGIVALKLLTHRIVR